LPSSEILTFAACLPLSPCYLTPYHFNLFFSLASLSSLHICAPVPRSSHARLTVDFATKTNPNIDRLPSGIASSLPSRRVFALPDLAEVYSLTLLQPLLLRTA